MASQTTPPTPDSPAHPEQPPFSRRHFLGTASVLAAGVIATGAAYRAQAATGTPRAEPVELSRAHWIWYPEGNPGTGAPTGHRYFRTAFTVAEGEVTDAQLVVTGDDTVDVWLNGKPLVSSPRVARSWRNALYVDLRSAVTTGSNTIALASRNQGGSAGVIGRLRVVTAGGTTDVVTDGSWVAGKSVSSGWEQPGSGVEGW